MEIYILGLLTLLIILVIGIVYLGHKQMNDLKIMVNRNINNIGAIQSLINHTNTENQYYRDNDTNNEYNAEVEYCEEIEPNMLDPELLNQYSNMVQNMSNSNDMPETIIEDDDEELEKELDNELIKEEQPIEDNQKDPIEDPIEDQPDKSQELEEEFKKELDEKHSIVSDDIKVVEIKKKPKQPSDPAKNYDEGYKMMYEGNEWEVTIFKNGSKRWKKIS